MTSPTPISSGRRGATVDVRSLSKSYNGAVALEGMSLAIGPGEFVALLGPSGCGKTTLLRCIAGLITPSAGDVLVDGRSITGLPVHRRGLGMVFQSYALFPHLTVGENVHFGLRMRGVGKAESVKRVSDALALVRLEDLSRRYPGQLSGGQQQRVALARSLVTNPSVLLLDEPFGALDAQLREAMQIELRRMQRQLGITAVFVTHDQREAFTMADRVAVLAAGTLQQFDTPTRIYNHPATPFVAKFIGQVNGLSGTVLDRVGLDIAVSVPGRSEPIWATAPADGFDAGARVQVMIRPERIGIVSSDSKPKRNQVRGTISDVIFSGEKISIFVDTEIGDLEVHRFSEAATEDLGLASGQPVALQWGAESTMVFSGS